MTAPGEGFKLGEAFVDVRVDDQTDPGVAKKLAQVKAQLDSVAIAEKRVQDAQGKAQVAQAKLTELRDQGVKSGAKLTAAEQGLAKANRDVEVAQLRLSSAQTNSTAAQQGLTDAQTRAKKAATDLAAAQAAAKRDAEQLAAAQADATAKAAYAAREQETLADAHRRATAEVEQLAEADSRLAPAVRRVQDAQSTAYVAQSRLNELRSRGSASASSMASAEEAVARADRQLQAAQAALADSGERAQKSQAGLLDVVVALGPALIPIAAELLAIGGAAVGMGAAAVLAFKGAGTAMKEGTGDGIRYSASVQTAKGDLLQLEDVASHGVLSGFEKSVDDLNGRMPMLRRETGMFAADLGDIAHLSVDATLGSFQTFAPVLQHAADYMDSLARRADEWANGPGGKDFASSIGRDFDQAVPALENIVGLFAHLIAAGNGAGLGILSTFGQVASAIDDIPMPILSALVQTLVVLKTMKIVGSVFDSIGGSLESLGDKAGGANSKLGSTLATVGKFAGNAGFIAGAVIGLNGLAEQLGHALVANDSLNASLDNSGSAQSSFYNSLIRSSGAVDDGVTSAVQYQLQQDKLTDKAAKAGISTDAMTSAVTGSDTAFQALIATWKKQGKPADDTIKALENVRNSYVLGTQASQQYIAEQENLIRTPTWGALNTTADSLTQVGMLFGITADQAKQYATMAGLTNDEISNGEGKNDDLAAAVESVAMAYDHATVNGQAFLSQVQQFSQSQGTDADRAALISATLKSAAGDALSYATTLNAAATAEKGLTDQITSAASAVGKNGESTRAYLDSIVNLKTGTIDYTNAAAAPLLSSLGQIQDAALQAASAEYQHNRAIGVDGKAAADQAYSVYTSQTGPMLEKQLTSLGLNKDAAHKLALQYEGVPSKVKTLIEQEGADPVLSVLKSIDRDLVDIARAWGIDVDADTGGAVGPIQRVQDQLKALRDKHVTITSDIVTNYIQTGNKQQAGSAGTNLAQQAGGGSVPEGWSTVGEGASNTWELVHKQGSQVDIIPNPLAQQMLPGGPGSAMPGFAGGTVNGIRYATDLSYHNAQVRAAAKSAGLTQQANTLVVKLDGTDAGAVLTHLFSSVSSLSTQTGRVLTDARKAVSLGAGPSSLITTLAKDNANLEYAATRRANVASKLDWANQNLANIEKKWTSEQQAVSQASLGTFDISSAGAGDQGGSFDRMIASLRGDVSNARSFRDEVARLKKLGLSNTLLAQLSAAGPGSPNALALQHATAGQIKELNADYHQLAIASTSTGNTVADAMYGSGVNAAKGLVAGLKSQEAALESQMRRLADSMVNELKTKLKIHSPSQVGHDIGANYGEGVIGGVDSKHDKLKAASARYGDAMTSFTGQPGTRAGGGAMHIGQMHVHLHTDQIEGLNSAAEFFTNLEQTVRAGGFE